MIKGFEDNKFYRYTGNKRMSGWDLDGIMEKVLDGKPRKCIIGNGYYANFEDCFTDGHNEGKGWFWGNGFENWEEVVSQEGQQVSTEKRKIIQISTCITEGKNFFTVKYTALCNDGTVWIYSGISQGKWEKLPLIPQDLIDKKGNM